jgi:hypothetical protein
MTSASLATGASRRPLYPMLLAWAFSGFSTLRLFAYLPAMAAIWQQGDSSQHSLLTWCAWLGGNLTMALWLREQHHGMTGAAWVSAANAVMCAATLALILAFR